MGITVIILLLTIFAVSSISFVTFEDAFAHDSGLHEKPGFTFHEREYNQDDTLYASCTNHDHRDVREYRWVISDITKDRPHRHTDEITNFGFFEISASKFLPGNYKIKCDIIFTDNNKVNDGWRSFSIVGIPPSITLDYNEYFTNATINTTCVDDVGGGMEYVTWNILDKQTNIETPITISYLEHSFPASDLGVGDFEIQCDIKFNRGHNESSLWETFSIISETVEELPPALKIVDPRPGTPPPPGNSTDITNYVDMTYNPDSKNLTISWNFGDNPHRESCNSKTEFYQENYLSLNPLTYDPTRHYLTFEGYNKNTFENGPLYLKNTDLLNSEIQCADEMIFNIESEHVSNFTDEFRLYMTFFEVILPDYRGEPQYDDIKPNGIMPLNAAQFVTTMKGDIESAKCGELDPSTDKWRFVELIYDVTGPSKTVYETLDGCYSDNPGEPYSIKEIAVIETKKKSSGSGCSGDCTSPTIGLDKNGVRFVDDGLKLNGVSFEGNYFKTHMPMQYTETGKMNHLSLKVYENSGAYNIDYIQFGIVKEIGSPINNYEPRIEIDVSNFANDIENPSLDNITLMDKEGIISYHNVTIDTTPCMNNSNQECLQLDIYWTFGKVPEFNVLLINGWDNDNNSFSTYFNDGLTTIDPNYVEPKVIEPSKYECKDPKLEDIQVWTRNNCNFDDRIITEQDRAVLVFDNTKLISIPAESWTYDLPKSDAEQQAELDVRLAMEADRAEKKLQQYFPYLYSGKVYD